MPSLPRVQEQFGLGRSGPAVDRTPTDISSSGTAARPILGSSYSSYMPSLSLSSGDTPDSTAAQEEQREEGLRRDIDRLIWETRMWRIANSTMWVMWGVMQATIEGLPKELMDDTSEAAAQSDPEDQQTPVAGGLNMRDLNDDPMKKLDLRQEEETIGKGGNEDKEKEEDEEEADEFDYLAYARDRALFWWGDMVTMGLVRKDELPAGIQKELKIVDH